MERDFDHLGGSISVEGSSARDGRGGAVLESSSGVAPDVCGDCSPLDTLLGPGKTLVEFPRFAFLRCLVSLLFRADGLDIVDILASGVPAAALATK